MALILLPNQLFSFTHISRFKDQKIYLIEHPLYFTSFNYHQFKLILHRASMKKYADRFDCTYINFDDEYEFIFKNNTEICIYNPNDHDIMSVVIFYTEIFYK